MRHGSNLDPRNRFEAVHQEPDHEHLEWDSEFAQPSARKIEYIDDASQSIVASNQSPDLPFTYSLNPYRGCVHGCAYCYARPSHEYLGMNAGLDFETRIVVKRNAAELLRKFLMRKSWEGEPIAFSGVTDCYQPAERTFFLTRDCLKVAAEFNQPISIVTKNALITRDLDILTDLAQRNLVHAYLSITTLRPELARDMEPRTSIPAARLRAIGELAQAGVPVGVMVAPIIPGLNDEEIPAILTAAQEAGATVAGSVMLRLPQTVLPVFQEWLERTQPTKMERIMGRIQQVRDGKNNDSSFGTRMRGTGEIADQIHSLFKIFRTKLGLGQKLQPFDQTLFQRPDADPDQLKLF